MALDHLLRFALHPRHWLKLGVSAAAAWLPRRSWRAILAANLCPPGPQTTHDRTGDHARTRFHGLTKTAITTSSPCRMSNSRAFTIQRKARALQQLPGHGHESYGQPADLGAPPPTTAAWRVGTGRDAGRNKLSSPVHDSPYSRDRGRRQSDPYLPFTDLARRPLLGYTRAIRWPGAQRRWQSGCSADDPRAHHRPAVLACDGCRDNPGLLGLQTVFQFHRRAPQVRRPKSAVSVSISPSRPMHWKRLVRFCRDGLRSQRQILRTRERLNS